MNGADYWQVYEQQLRQQMSARVVRWRCVFCYREVAEEWSDCCGEHAHTEPMTEGDDEN